MKNVINKQVAWSSKDLIKTIHKKSINNTSASNWHNQGQLNLMPKDIKERHNYLILKIWKKKHLWFSVHLI